MQVPLMIMAAATAAQAIGAISSSQSAASADKYNASVAEQNSTAVMQQAAGAARIQQEQAQRTIGAATANYGASGIVSGTGTPLDVLANSASTAERDRQSIIYKGQLQSIGYQDEATLDRSNATNSLNQGYMKATGILLSGGSKAYGMMPSGGSPAYTGDGNGEF